MRVYRKRGHAGPENSNVIPSYLFTCFFLAGQGSSLRGTLSLTGVSGGYSLVAVHRLLIAVDFFVVSAEALELLGLASTLEHGLSSCGFPGSRHSQPL